MNKKFHLYLGTEKCTFYHNLREHFPVFKTNRLILQTMQVSKGITGAVIFRCYFKLHMYSHLNFLMRTV